MRWYLEMELGHQGGALLVGFVPKNRQGELAYFLSTLHHDMNVQCEDSF
jgi:hypothetical protein